MEIPIINSIINRKFLQKKICPPIALSFLGVAIFLPFLGKAFHIDDPMFIWTAKRISSHILDFYGFSVNWFGQTVPAFQVMQNPPLFSYYLAIYGLLSWNEALMHLAVMVSILALIWGIYFLADQFGANPVPAVLISICSPIFILSGTTVMCDMTMLSFWIWAIYFWVCGLERPKRNHYLAISAVLITAAGLTKYFGIFLIPILATYSLHKGISVKRWLPFFLIPVAFFLLYEWGTFCMYGVSLITDAFGYSAGVRNSEMRSITDGFLLGLSLSGGGLITAFFLFPLLIRGGRWTIAAVLIMVALVSLILLKGEIAGFNLTKSAHLFGQFIVYLITGAGIIFFAVAEFWQQRDSKSLLLTVWIIGTFIFACQVNWTISGRIFLPIVPAVGIILSRRLSRENPGLKNCWFSLALVPALIISISLAYIDYRWAGEHRNAAEQISSQYSNDHQNLWFQGHWGFQYYMEKAGFRHIECSSALKSGDIVATPSFGNNLIPLKENFVTIQTFKAELVPWISVMDSSLGAGFYMTFGPMPYAFGRVSPIYFYVALFKPSHKKN